MQQLSAYLLQSPELSDADFVSRRDLVAAAVDRWLISKKVSDPRASEGHFKSRTPGHPDGLFSREILEAGGGYLDQTTLTEESGRLGQNIETLVDLVMWERRASVYVRVNVYRTATILTPASIVPRCPKIIQQLLKMSPDWLITGETAPSCKPRELWGKLGGVELSEELLSSTRVVPIVVISEFSDGGIIWNSLPEHLASDLAGLAHVVVIDESASQEVSRELGGVYGCRGGAVRLYWPLDYRHNQRGRPYGIRWSVRELVEFDVDDKGEERFREAVRGIVMPVSAQTVAAPRGIRLIQDAAAMARIEQIRSQHSAAIDPETIAIVEAYEGESKKHAAESERLRRELEEANEKLLIVKADLESAKHALQRYNDTRPQPESPEVEEDSDADAIAIPKAGDIRYVKKTGENGPRDRMKERGDCGHKKWESMGNAPKALKGLQHLYEANSDFKRIEKCLTCTGGGVWRVTW